MKLLIIPDVHGIMNWEQPLKISLQDKDIHIIFLGDYVDGIFDTTTIMENLKKIIYYKKRYLDRITLLLGNHDYSYIFEKRDLSGFDYGFADNYKEIFIANFDLFQIAWGFQGKEKYTLVTHAGLTKSFYKNIVKEIENESTSAHNLLIKSADSDWKKLPLHELLNYFIDNSNLMWQIGTERRGHFPTGSIIWADRNELIDDNYPGIDQIVGHTNLYFVNIVDVKNDKLYFTDVHSVKELMCLLVELN